MEHVAEFLDKVRPYARMVESRYGIPSAVVTAQAALETGWGRFVRGHNFFGIKGSGQEFATHEYINNQRIEVTDSFRVYEGIEQSFVDYGELLYRSERYRSCFEHKKDPRGFARALQAAGYATDPKYADKLISIMERWNLIVDDVRTIRDAIEDLYITALLCETRPDGGRDWREDIDRLPVWLQAYREHITNAVCDFLREVLTDA